LERGICADVALVKAWKADTLGNLVYRKDRAQFQPEVATCGKITIAEAEIVVEAGELDPDQIHTPGIYVHRLVHNPNPEKRIEQRTTERVGNGLDTRADGAARPHRNSENVNM